MKRLTTVLAATVLAMFLGTQDATAFPGEGVLHRAAHFGHKVVYKIDNHVVHPVTHGVKRRLR